jgi:hypothetical protein
MNDHDRRRPRPRACEEVRTWLSAGGDRTAEQQARLQAHLLSCEDCRAVASWIDDVDRLARGLPPPAAPDPAYFASLRASVMREIAARTPGPSGARRGWRSLLRLPVLAPAVLVVVLASVFTLQQWRHGPVEVAPAPVRDLRPAIPEPGRPDQSADQGNAQGGPSAMPESRQASGKDEQAKKLEAGREAPLGAEKAQLAREEAPAPAEVGSTGPEAAAVSQTGAAPEAAVPETPEVSTGEPGFADALSGGVLDESRIRRSLENARAEEGHPDEAIALVRLLEAVEGRTVPETDTDLRALGSVGTGPAAAVDEPAPSRAASNERQDRPTGPARTPPITKAQRPVESARRARTYQLMAPSSEAEVSGSADSLAVDLADSVAAYLRVRLGGVEDAALRQRIESWLQAFARPDSSRE